jgi:hypothetical protein
MAVLLDSDMRSIVLFLLTSMINGEAKPTADASWERRSLTQLAASSNPSEVASLNWSKAQP